jgi:hypothetical protein
MFSFLLSASLCAGVTIPRRAEIACNNPTKRIEWRNLGSEVQKQYVDAVLCLKTKPSGLGLNTTRYDDFPYVHTHLDNTSTWIFLFFTLHFHTFQPQGLTQEIYSSHSSYVPSLAQTLCSDLRRLSPRMRLHWSYAVWTHTHMAFVEVANSTTLAIGIGLWIRMM